MKPAQVSAKVTVLPQAASPRAGLPSSKPRPAMATNTGPSRLNTPRRATPAPAQVRIIGGRLKRSKLPVLDKNGLRPTPDRVRETLFNWLGQDLSGWQVVDAFAGTGALGLEAASRGAAHVTLIEQDAALAQSLQLQVNRLQLADCVQVRHQSALQGLNQIPHGSVHLAFIDPPYQAKLYTSTLNALQPALQAQAWVYLEADHPFDNESLAAWQLTVVKTLKAGLVYAHLLQHTAT